MKSVLPDKCISALGSRVLGNVTATRGANSSSTSGAKAADPVKRKSSSIFVACSLPVTRAPAKFMLKAGSAAVCAVKSASMLGADNSQCAGRPSPGTAMSPLKFTATRRSCLNPESVLKVNLASSVTVSFGTPRLASKLMLTGVTAAPPKAPVSRWNFWMSSPG